MFCQKVLLAFDGTEGAQHALDKTKELATLNPTMHVHLIYVHEQPKIVIGDAYVAKPSTDDSDLNKESIAKLKRAELELSSVVNCTSEVVISDNPELVMLELAKKMNVDLIVIGSRGLSGIKKLFLGSVSNYIVNHASIPVLVTK